MTDVVQYVSDESHEQCMAKRSLTSCVASTLDVFDFVSLDSCGQMAPVWCVVLSCVV